MLSELLCGCYFVYSPRDPSARGNRARNFCYRLKRGEHEAARVACQHIRDHLEQSPLQSLLGSDVTLVPMPRCSPSRQNAIWPSRILVQSLLECGLGRDWQPLLQRQSAVQRSATAPAGERPDPKDHYDSFRVSNLTSPPRAITVVDDVVTRGATMVGAVSRLRETFRDVPVRGFAFVRTTSFEPVTANPVPVISTITLADGVVNRDP